METTFISIHDLSLDARLLYVSTSIEDILGYAPHEVIGKSCWEYFHPDEIPFAQAIHGRSIQLDKAAVLNYCQVKNRYGRWVGCECVFTVVHDVIVASTSVYKGGEGSQQRAKAAPVIRKLFSSSPRDPRYHMLQYISAKFSQKIPTQVHEPRAALFLNRFSRTLTIMYATNGLADLLGMPADHLTGKSFYYCIQENCLREAVKCLESAKANDSIAYLRFWFRDPRQDDLLDHDEPMSDGQSSGDEDDGGVNLAELLERDGSEPAVTSDACSSIRSSAERESAHSRNAPSLDPNSRSSSDDSTAGLASDAIFDPPDGPQSRTSSISTPDDPHASGQPWASHEIELEAVVSCTSDGLVVVLRGARPFVPDVHHPALKSAKSPFTNGLFASPWANHPIIPDLRQRANPMPDHIQPALFPVHPTAHQVQAAVNHGPPIEDFMNSIKEVAVFAWALTGINGSLAQYGRGNPIGESQPSLGLSVWDPNSTAGPESTQPCGYLPSPYSFQTNGYPNGLHHRGRVDECSYDAGYASVGRHSHPAHHGNGHAQVNAFNRSLQDSHQQHAILHPGGPSPVSKKSLRLEGPRYAEAVGYQPQPSGYAYDSQTTGCYPGGRSNGPWLPQPRQESFWDPANAPSQVLNGCGSI